MSGQSDNVPQIIVAVQPGHSGSDNQANCARHLICPAIEHSKTKGMVQDKGGHRSSEHHRRIAPHSFYRAASIEASSAPTLPRIAGALWDLVSVLNAPLHPFDAPKLSWSPSNIRASRAGQNLHGFHVSIARSLIRRPCYGRSPEIACRHAGPLYIRRPSIVCPAEIQWRLS